MTLIDKEALRRVTQRAACRVSRDAALESDLVTACSKTISELRDTWSRPVHFERIGQLRADKAGQDRGAPDAILCVGSWCHPLEFKRAKGGRFSLDQLVAAERRRAAGVVTYAPSHITHFDALLKWSERNGAGAGVCPHCPTVPDP